MKRRNNVLRFTLRLLLFIVIFAIAVCSIMFFSIYFSTKLDKNAIIAPKAQIELIDSDGNVMENARLYKYISYDDISPNIINAFIAMEDKRFYNHKGIDYYRTAGALFNDIKSGTFKEGGSTITQQLAKNTQLSNEKTIKRKIREMRLAREIEKNYTKNEILEMYLNAIYFGSGIYGIDSACKNYFNKSPSEISVSEGAILAGIVKNPQKYSPKNNADIALTRRNIVLKLMHEQEFITDKAYTSALSESYYSPTESVFSDQFCTPYYNSVLSEACKILDCNEKSIIQSKYKIYTYYSPCEQKSLFDAFNSKSFESVNKNNEIATYSALISDNESGGIIAYYCNADFDVNNLRRQPASTIKPIVVYAPALEYGLITTQSAVLDEAININGYKPSNYANNYLGWTTVETALAKSINTVAVKIFSDVGINNALSFAENCGLVFDEKDNNLSTALGGLTYGCTMPQMSEAYMTLANNGLYRKNCFIREIIDENGKTVYKNSETTRRVMSSDTAFLTTDMLVNTVNNGTASKLNEFPYQIAAKTGTAQSPFCEHNLDAWNVSYTTKNTLVVWYGDLKKSEKTAIETTGSAYPTLLAKHLYRTLEPPKEANFFIPNTILSTEIDKYALDNEQNLYLCNYYTPLQFRKNCYFSIKNCPTTVSPYFDLNDISFDIKINGDMITVEIAADSPYKFNLVEKDLLKRTVREYACTTGKNDIIIQDKNKIYSYYLAVYYENNFLGYTDNKLIFI